MKRKERGRENEGEREGEEGKKVAYLIHSIS